MIILFSIVRVECGPDVPRIIWIIEAAPVHAVEPADVFRLVVADGLHPDRLERRPGHHRLLGVRGAVPARLGEEGRCSAVPQMPGKFIDFSFFLLRSCRMSVSNQTSCREKYF